MSIQAIEEVAVTVFDVLRELITHSTIGGSHKDALHRAVDVLDPSVEVKPLPDVPETQEEELARLRAESAAVAPAETV